MRVLISIVAVAALTACETMPNDPAWKPEAALLTLCDPTGPMLEGGTGKEIVPWGVAMRKELETCAARHKRLVEAIPKEK